MKNHLLTILTLVTMFSQTACISRKAQLSNFQTGEILRAKFTDSPGTNGRMTVTMTDGEVLQGNYSAIRGHDVATFSSAFISGSAHGTAQTAYSESTFGKVGRTPLHIDTTGNIQTTASVNSSAQVFEQKRSIGGTGQAYGILSSTTPGSKLMMEIIVTYGVLSGHGWGEARTNDGRVYRVTF